MELLERFFKSDPHGILFEGTPQDAFEFYYSFCYHVKVDATQAQLDSYKRSFIEKGFGPIELIKLTYLPKQEALELLCLTNKNS